MTTQLTIEYPDGDELHLLYTQDKDREWLESTAGRLSPTDRLYEVLRQTAADGTLSGGDRFTWALFPAEVLT